MKLIICLFVSILGISIPSVASVHAADAEPSTTSNRVPLTRPDMKVAIEALKDRAPRIPMPEITEQERQTLGERADHYEARLRLKYLAHEPARTSSRENDSAMSLSYEFKTMMFWIVARMNNCHYCMGHQELKLAVAGLDDDRIAALDGDWSEFTEAERAAFSFARLMTHHPHQVGDDDIAALRKFYSDLQILEMLFSVSGNNSTNRWKEAIGVMQERDASLFRNFVGGSFPTDRPLPIKSYITPTSEKFLSLETILAPVRPSDFSENAAAFEAARRPALETRAEVEQMLAKCAARTPRLPLVDDDQARQVLGEAWIAESYPNWVRLLANFPRDGKSRVLGIVAAEEKGELDPLLKAQASWISARQDRAWYALGRAKARLLSLGQTEDEIYALDGDWSGYSPAQQAVFHFTSKITRTPDLFTDRDTAKVVKHLGPRDTTQLASHVTNMTFLNRLTEAAGLPLDR